MILPHQVDKFFLNTLIFVHFTFTKLEKDMLWAERLNYFALMISFDFLILIFWNERVHFSKLNFHWQLIHQRVYFSWFHLIFFSIRSPNLSSLSQLFYIYWFVYWVIFSILLTCFRKNLKHSHKILHSVYDLCNAPFFSRSLSHSLWSDRKLFAVKILKFCLLYYSSMWVVLK